MSRWGNFFKKRSKQKKEYLLALDIGTEFIKALILKAEKFGAGNDVEKGAEKNENRVIGFGRQRQLPNHMLAGAVADIEGVALTCQKAIVQAETMARLRPTKAVIGIAGEFIKGATSNFTYQRSKPEEEISLGEFQNIIQKIQRKAFDKMRSQLAWEIGRSEVEIRLINALIGEIRIDGYQVTNPIGFPGREIFLSVFNVYAPLVHLHALERIAQRLNLELLAIAAESYALTRCSRFNPLAGAIFIDIGGGTTDIALARQGKMEGIKSFALAGRTFTKRLSQTLGLGLWEAEDLKIRHSYQELSPSVQYKIRQILKNDTNIWLNGVELILEEFNQTEFFPALILLCGGGSLLPGIRSILKKEEIRQRWLDKFPFSDLPQIGFIQPSHICNLVDKTGLLRGAEDITPMALASLALEINADEEKVLPSTMRRVIRMMR